MAVRIRHRNPPFHKSIRRLYDLSSTSTKAAKLQRGFIKTDEQVLGGGTGAGDVFYLFFLYNPGTLDLGHGADPNYPLTPVQGGKQGAQMLTTLQQSLSFALMFDRHYEVMETNVISGVSGRQIDLAEYGVYADILTLYDMLGITQESGTSFTEQKAQGPYAKESDRPTVGGKSGTYWNRPVAPMRVIPLRFFFSKHLRYRAVISNASIQYTHWTEKMVPSRCTVTINANLLPEFQGEVSSSSIYQESWDEAKPLLFGNGDTPLVFKPPKNQHEVD